MPVILTTVVQVRDWRALQQMHREFLVGRVRELGATRCQVCRDVDNASRVLIVVEGPEQELIADLGRDLDQQLGALIVPGTGTQQIWEPIVVHGNG